MMTRRDFLHRLGAAIAAALAPVTLPHLAHGRTAAPAAPAPPGPLAQGPRGVWGLASGGSMAAATATATATATAAWGRGPRGIHGLERR